MLYVVIPKPSIVEHTSYSSAYYDSQGELLRLTLAKDERYRLWVPIDKIATVLQQATVLYEDRYFYQHQGVNLVALIRAFFVSYIKRSRKVGASTITMQLARLRYGLNTRTLSGKTIQILRALQIERHYSKAQILEAYLNLAPYGANIEGVGAASLIYFDQSANNISLSQALLLSLIPQNPNKRNPIKIKAHKLLVDSRQKLFTRWLQQYPQHKHYQAEMNLPISVQTPADLPFKAPHFVNHIQQRYPYLPSAQYQTSINLQLQTLLEQHARAYVKRRQGDGIENTAALLLNYRTMQVAAELGSVDFFADAISGQVNGTHAKRSPGSTLKPFIYALAMDQGLIHPLTLLKDAPRRFGAYTPENYDQKFIGPVSATDALVLSRNVPAVNLLLQLESPGFYGMLQAADIEQLQAEDFYGLALALGGNEVSMYELVQLYAMLANRGRYQKAVTIPGYQRQQEKSLLSAEAAYLVLDMLRQNPAVDQSDFQIKAENNYPVYWKTGTSFAFRDAWSVGIVGPYVLAVWVGNFSGEGNPAFIGREAAAPLFFEIIRSLELRNQSSLHSDFLQANLNITEVDICAETGDLPNRHCPSSQKGWFIPGKSPIKLSSIHREIYIDKKTGKRACRYHPATTEKSVYEFWPSDLIKLFKQAGIAKRQPPAYLSSCSLNTLSRSGLAPDITSPSDLVSYTIRASNEQDESIPFTAVTDSDAKFLYWFVDNRFIGKTKRDEPLFWHPEVGQFKVSVIDDLGRGNNQTISVHLVN